jgi:hypothetical protein
MRGDAGQSNKVCASRVLASITLAPNLPACSASARPASKLLSIQTFSMLSTASSGAASVRPASNGMIDRPSLLGENISSCWHVPSLSAHTPSELLRVVIFERQNGRSYPEYERKVSIRPAWPCALPVHSAHLYGAFVVCTYEAEHVLIPAADTDKAIGHVRAAGHTVNGKHTLQITDVEGLEKTCRLD